MKTIERQATAPFSAASTLVAAMLFFCATILLAMPPSAQAATQSAGTYSLTLTECQVSGQTITAYRVANWEKGGLTLDAALAQAKEETGIDPTAFDRTTSAETLRTAATTYAGYVAEQAASLKSYKAAVSSGTATFENMAPGMYLIPEMTVTVGNTAYEQSPLLVSVPSSDESGNLTNNVTVNVKTSKNTVKKFANRVQKLWNDASASAKRPASVTVRIYNGTKLDRTVELNAQNNWTYRWNGAGNWSVEEERVSSSYTHSVTKSSTVKDGVQTTTFQVTNKTKGKSTNGGTSPKTGDYLPILGLILIAIGAGIVVAALSWRRRREKHGGTL